MVITQGSEGQKRKYPNNTASNEKKYVKKQDTGAKGNGNNMPFTSNAHKNKGFKGKGNYCHNFGHKKTNCMKLKVVREKKDDDKKNESN